MHHALAAAARLGWIEVAHTPYLELLQRLARGLHSLAPQQQQQQQQPAPSPPAPGPAAKASHDTSSRFVDASGQLTFFDDPLELQQPGAIGQPAQQPRHSSSGALMRSSLGVFSRPASHDQQSSSWIEQPSSWDELLELGGSVQRGVNRSKRKLQRAADLKHSLSDLRAANTGLVQQAAAAAAAAASSTTAAAAPTLVSDSSAAGDATTSSSRRRRRRATAVAAASASDPKSNPAPPAASLEESAGQGEAVKLPVQQTGSNPAATQPEPQQEQQQQQAQAQQQHQHQQQAGHSDVFYEMVDSLDGAALSAYKQAELAERQRTRRTALLLRELQELWQQADPATAAARLQNSSSSSSSSGSSSSGGSAAEGAMAVAAGYRAAVLLTVKFRSLVHALVAGEAAAAASSSPRRRSRPAAADDSSTSSSGAAGAAHAGPGSDAAADSWCKTRHSVLSALRVDQLLQVAEADMLPAAKKKGMKKAVLVEHILKHELSTVRQLMKHLAAPADDSDGQQRG